MCARSANSVWFFFVIVVIFCFLLLFVSFLTVFFLSGFYISNFLCVLRFSLPLMLLLLLWWRLANAFIDHYMQLSLSPHPILLCAACLQQQQCVRMCILYECVFISLYSRFISIHSITLVFSFFVLFLYTHASLAHGHFQFNAFLSFDAKAKLHSLHLNVMCVTFVERFASSFNRHDFFLFFFFKNQVTTLF